MPIFCLNIFSGCPRTIVTKGGGLPTVLRVLREVEVKLPLNRYCFDISYYFFLFRFCCVDLIFFFRIDSCSCYKSSWFQDLPGAVYMDSILDESIYNLNYCPVYLQFFTCFKAVQMSKLLFSCRSYTHPESKYPSFNRHKFCSLSFFSLFIFFLCSFFCFLISLLVSSNFFGATG